MIPIEHKLTSGEEKSKVHRRHDDWEPYDKITVEIVPRLKTSGMSGDEWRTSAKITLWHKGRPIVEDSRMKLDFAIANLTALIAQHSCPIDQKVIDVEKYACDQPGCPEPAISVYRLKALFSESGQRLHPDEGSYADHFRQFCGRHLYRGDCSREDCDDNYEVVHGPGPNDSQERAEDESPASQLVVNVDSLDDLPAAIDLTVNGRTDD